MAVMLVFNHLNGTGGAVSGTVATTDTIGEHHAIVLDPDGMTSMDAGLLFFGDGLDGSRRTDLAATGTLRTAIAAFERHGGLHEVHEIRRGTQHMVGTGRYAKLTSGAVLLHVSC